jgi:selenophosphate synthetase-related protein
VLEQLADDIRSAPRLQAKRHLAILGRRSAGDDAAIVAHGGELLLMCAEAIVPTFVRADPRAAGAAAVVTNVSDIRAMGGRPLALVDTVVSPDRAHARAVLDGIGWAAGLLGVDVVGGHLTIGHAPALSASCTGVARRPLTDAGARAGDVVLAAFCTDGRYTGPDSLFWSSLRDREPERLRDDGEALVEVAEGGLVSAARDVSMPGAAGSLLQLLEGAGLGAVLDVGAIPRPPGVEPGRWLLTFPSFGFVLTAPPQLAERAVEPFARRGLACAACGVLDDGRALRLRDGAQTALVWDLASEPLTASPVR